MFENAIFKQATKNLVLLGETKLMSDAYLAGGTALALQLGHRISYDLDFFTPKEFKPKIFLAKIGKIKNYRHERIDWGTVLGRLDNIKFSLFYYPYKLLKKPLQFNGVNIASIEDIGAMKLAAVSERGTKRDFIDLYFIFILQKISLKDILSFYDQKYQKLAVNSVHIQKSLLYFADAEKDAMPRMIKEVSWRKVKKFFENEVKKIND